MTKIKAVIFDLDGTLLNTLADLAASVNYALRSNSLPERSTAEVRQFLGNGIRQLMLKAVGSNCQDDALFEKTFQTFRTYYVNHCHDATAPYPGILSLLASLKAKHVKMAIVSNKLDPAVKELNHEFFSDFIEVAVGESETVRRKPCPDAVLKAIDELGCTPEESIYVGDSEVDYATALNAGTRHALVLWGFRDEDFLRETGATMFVRRPEDLANLLD